MREPVFKCKKCGDEWFSPVRLDCEESGLCWGCMEHDMPKYIPYKQMVKYIKLKEQKNDKRKI